MSAVQIVALSRDELAEMLEEAASRGAAKALAGGSSAPALEPRPLTTEEAADYAQRSPDTIREWIRSGRLRTLPRIGKQRIRIRPADLVAAMERALDASAPVDELAEVRAKIARARQRSAGQG